MPISMLGGRRVILLTEGKAPPNFHTLFKVIDTKYSKSAVWRGAQKSNLWLGGVPVSIGPFSHVICTC